MQPSVLSVDIQSPLPGDTDPFRRDNNEGEDKALQATFHVYTGKDCADLLWPGTFLMCRAFTIQMWGMNPSNTLYIGFQYTPVLSMATWVMPNDNSHSLNCVKELVKVLKLRVSCLIPSPRTVATTTSLWMSIPQPRDTTCVNVMSDIV